MVDPEERYGQFVNPAMISLARRSEMQNEAAPHTYQPISTLSQYKWSNNGMSTRDGERMLPGLSGRQLPTSNGASQGTLETQNNLRMAGGLPL
jgi:hypothetical protein